MGTYQVPVIVQIRTVTPCQARTHSANTAGPVRPLPGLHSKLTGQGSTKAFQDSAMPRPAVGSVRARPVRAQPCHTSFRPGATTGPVRARPWITRLQSGQGPQWARSELDQGRSDLAQVRTRSGPGQSFDKGCQILVRPGPTAGPVRPLQGLDSQQTGPKSGQELSDLSQARTRSGPGQS